MIADIRKEHPTWEVYQPVWEKKKKAEEAPKEEETPEEK